VKVRNQISGHWKVTIRKVVHTNARDATSMGVSAGQNKNFARTVEYRRVTSNFVKRITEYRDKNKIIAS